MAFISKIDKYYHIQINEDAHKINISTIQAETNCYVNFKSIELVCIAGPSIWSVKVVVFNC